MRKQKKKKCLKSINDMVIRKRNVLLFAALALSTLVMAQEPKLQVVDKVVAVVGKNIILQSDVETSTSRSLPTRPIWSVPFRLFAIMVTASLHRVVALRTCSPR